jgi:hypothetical protein
MEIVIVYLGRRVPKYVFLNLSLLQSRFPDRQIVFLSDFSKNIEIGRRLGIKSILVPSPQENWEIKPTSFNHDLRLRDGFWYKTFARFHSLNHYSMGKPFNSFLHVEADVLLLPNFPFERFFQIKAPLAYPLSTTRNAAASTLYVENYAGFSEFMSFAESRVSTNPNATDMTVLADYADEHPERVFILPSTIDNQRSFTKVTSLDDRKKFFENANFFSGIFDANTWGQFLTGQDERNNRGIRRIYHHMPHHAIDPQNFDFFFDENINVSIDNQQVSLFSLHIHSKDKRFFRFKSAQINVKLAIEGAKYGPACKFRVSTAIVHFLNSSRNLAKRYLLPS